MFFHPPYFIKMRFCSLFVHGTSLHQMCREYQGDRYSESADPWEQCSREVSFSYGSYDGERSDQALPHRLSELVSL